MTAAYNVQNLLVFPGIGDGTFRTPSTLTSPIFSNVGIALDSADFNGDGKLDLLVTEPDGAIVFFGNGDGTFPTTVSPFTCPGLPTGATVNPSFEVPLPAVADLDGNKTSDIVIADDNTYILSAFLNDGTGKFLQASPDFQANLSPGTGALRLADLNGDGLPDIILTNYKTQNLSIFLSVNPRSTPAATLASSTAQALVGAPVTLTVQLKPAGAQTPTGAVTLTSGATSYGQQTLNASGQATFTLPSTLAAGQYTFTAAYAGDTYNYPVTTTLTQSITDFSLTLPTPTQSVAVGASATYSLSLAPLYGFTGAVTVTCTGLPTGFACAPLSPTLNGQNATAALVVSPPSTTASLAAPPHRGTPTRTSLALLALPLLGLALHRRRRIPLALLLLFAATAAATALSGCGGSSAATKPTPYTGTSSFTITATTTQGSTTVTHQTTATLTVQ